MPRYVIYGAGAIGGAIGATLFEQGHEVVLIARGAHLTAIQNEGLRFDSPHGSITQKIEAVDHPDKINFRDGDVVMISTKSQDTIEVLHALQESAPLEIPIVCVQNGVENERVALRMFPNVYGVMIICPATYLSPGVVETASAAKHGIIAIGRYPHGEDELSKQIANDLLGSGWYAESSPTIQDWKYAKLLDNLANATQVVCGLEARGGEIADRAKKEGVDVLEKAGIAYLPLDRFRELRSANVKGAGSGPVRGASTWQSIARGTGSVETDYLNGEIVMLGREFDIETPINLALQLVTAEVARGARPAGSLSEEDFLSLAER